MTEQEAKNKLIAWAEAQIGTREGANNYNRYAKGMEKLYGWDVQNQPWCDVFVDAGFVECFGLERGMAMTYQFPGCAGAACRYSAQYYKNAGRWFPTPQPGDQIFLYVDGGINHTGIVTAVEGGRVTAVEGNSSDMVSRRVYAAQALNIAGYGRPNWALAANGGAAGSSPAVPPASAVPETPVRYAPYAGEKPADAARRAGLRLRRGGRGIRPEDGRGADGFSARARSRRGRGVRRAELHRPLERTKKGELMT